MKNPNSLDMFCEYPDVMSVQDIQSALGIGRSMAYKLLSEGSIKNFRIGKSRRIAKVHLIEYVLGD